MLVELIFFGELWYGFVKLVDFERVVDISDTDFVQLVNLAFKLINFPLVKGGLSLVILKLGFNVWGILSMLIDIFERKFIDLYRGGL